MIKSLLSKTSSKTKKKNKYSETSKVIKDEYKFELKEKVIYLGGLYEDKNGFVCVIVSRSRTRNGKQYYKIEFEDGLIIESIMDVLKKVKVESKEEIERNGDDEIID